MKNPIRKNHLVKVVAGAAVAVNRPKGMPQLVYDRLFSLPAAGHVPFLRRDPNTGENY